MCSLLAQNAFATFSVVAVDKEKGLAGVALASCTAYLGINNIDEYITQIAVDANHDLKGIVQRQSNFLALVDQAAFDGLPAVVPGGVSPRSGVSVISGSDKYLGPVKLLSEGKTPSQIIAMMDESNSQPSSSPNYMSILDLRLPMNNDGYIFKNQDKGVINSYDRIQYSIVDMKGNAAAHTGSFSFLPIPVLKVDVGTPPFAAHVIDNDPNDRFTYAIQGNTLQVRSMPSDDPKNIRILSRMEKALLNNSRKCDGHLALRLKAALRMAAKLGGDKRCIRGEGIGLNSKSKDISSDQAYIKIVNLKGEEVFSVKHRCDYASLAAGEKCPDATKVINEKIQAILADQGCEGLD